MKKKIVGLQGYKAILFDLEGVIIDSESIWDLETKEFLGRRGIAYDREAIKHVCAGRSVFEAARYLKESYALEGSVQDLGRERLAIFRSLLPLHLRFIPGFERFFREIKGTHKTAIATSMDESLLTSVITILCLDRMFGRDIYSLADAGGVAKPAPELFLFAAAKLGINPSSCLVIEDSPIGITAAHRAGMQVCGLLTTFGNEILKEADFVIGSFDELRIR